MGLMMIMWNGREEDTDLRSVRNMKAPTMKMETVTLIGEGR
jgi:hypothetical protein